MVRKGRNSAAKRLHDLDLCRRVGHMVGPAHDIGHAHFRVIDHGRQSIQNLPVAADQHGVGDRCRIDRDIAQDTVFPLDPFLIQLEAPHAGAAFVAQLGFFRIRQVQRGAVIDRRLAHVELFLALEVQLGRGFPGFIEPPDLAQLVRGGVVFVQPFGLTLNAVPMQAEPCQVFFQTVDVFFLAAHRIGVVDPQDELSAVLAGDQIVHQRRAQVAYVDIAGRGRGEAGDGHWVLLIGRWLVTARHHCLDNVQRRPRGQLGSRQRFTMG